MKKATLQDIQNYILNTHTLDSMMFELLDELTMDSVDVQDALAYMQDIVSYGSIAGCSKLVYHWQIVDYLGIHAYTIQEYINQLGELTGGSLDMESFTIDNMVWLAYDYMVGEFLDIYEAAIKDIEEAYNDFEGDEE